MIAGRIIPAIATTTAMITGAVMFELYKVVQGFDKIEDYRNAFINLGISNYVFTEPTPPKVNSDVEMDPVMFMPIKAIPKDWTKWTFIEVKAGSLTVDQFKEWVKEHYSVDVSMICVGKWQVFNSIMSSHADRGGRKIEEINKQINQDGVVEGRNYLALGIAGSTTDDNTEVTMPTFKYVFA